MTPRFLRAFLPALIVSCLIACGPAGAVNIPDAAKDTALVKAADAKDQHIVLAGGCFWGVQAVFQHTKGVKSAVSGYAGGDAGTANYPTVSSGKTGHAESVDVTYDPSKITLGQILKVYFSVAHDPTELNFQGPDHGTQYRSEIYTTSPEQADIANAYIRQLDAAKTYAAPIVTKVEPLKGFYPAEAYHQDFARLNPNYPYIVINDAPKVAALKQQLPDLYKD